MKKVVFTVFRRVTFSLLCDNELHKISGFSSAHYHIVEPLILVVVTTLLILRKMNLSKFSSVTYNAGGKVIFFNLRCVFSTYNFTVFSELPFFIEKNLVLPHFSVL